MKKFTEEEISDINSKLCEMKYTLVKRGKGWEEEFEDDIVIGNFGEGSGEINIEGLAGCDEDKRTLHQLLQKYFVFLTDEEIEKRPCFDNYKQKVKIKARKGAILIERVK